MSKETNYDPAIERRYPLIEVTAELAARLLEPLAGLGRPRELTLLAGGHVNTNFLVKLPGGEKVVLRLYASGEDAFRRETGLLRELRGSIPVANLRLAALEPKLLAQPYAVLDWVDGLPLNEVVSAKPEAAAQIGEAIAATLLKIGARKLDACAPVAFAEYIRQCLFERGASRHLGERTSQRLWAFVQAKNALLAELAGSEGLVHGDFQNDNILLTERSGKWEVSAVLDWEWASNGSYLRDLGTLLRFRCDASPAFQAGLESGFAHAGSPLPGEWKMAATLHDMAAQCEKLTHPTHRGAVTVRSIKMVERCLDENAR